MSIHPQTEKSISERAAQWVASLQSGGAREHAAFAAWLRESPQHVREYLLMTALEKELGEVDLQGLDIDGLLAKVGRNIVPLKTTPHPRIESGAGSVPLPQGQRGPASRRYRLAIAAGLIGATIAAGWWGFVQRAATYSTAVGEQRTFELADGSAVQLNPASRIRVRISAEARDVELLAGEALFKVKHETVRPFRVRSGAALIEDLGTQFHVYRRSSGTVVSVIEGAVQIASVRLDAGQEGRVATDGKTVERSTLDPAQLDSWRERHLTFSGDTLADIAADFNRYNRKPQIRVEGAALQAKRYSGGFDADDPESLIEYLRQSDAIEVRRAGDELVVRPR
jgi:transmembrane sensor